MNELTNGGCGGLKPPAKALRLAVRALARLNYKKRIACNAQPHEVLTRGARLCLPAGCVTLRTRPHTRKSVVTDNTTNALAHRCLAYTRED